MENKINKVMNEIFRMIGMVVVAVIIFALTFGLFGKTAQLASSMCVAIFGIFYMVAAIFPGVINKKKVKKEEEK